MSDIWTPFDDEWQEQPQEAVGVGGRPFVDVYALSGAATAIDAAVLACSGG